MVKMVARLEIRIPQEDKEKLERLAEALGVTVSDIMRDVVTRIAQIEKSIEVSEAIENIEKVVVKAIIKSQQFQNLLKEIKQRYEGECERWVGFNESKLFRYTCVERDYVITEENGKLVPRRIVWDIEVNEYGREWISEHGPIKEFKEIGTLGELKEFLETIEFVVDQDLERKIKEIKEMMKSGDGR